MDNLNEMKSVMGGIGWPIDRAPQQRGNLELPAGTVIVSADNHWSVGDDIFYKKSVYGHPLPFAVLVSHISRTWRDVAIRNPFLWITIRIIHSRSNYLCFMYVDRSQPCSLDVRFTCDVERAHYDFDSSILHVAI